MKIRFSLIGFIFILTIAVALAGCVPGGYLTPGQTVEDVDTENEPVDDHDDDLEHGENENDGDAEQEDDFNVTQAQLDMLALINSARAENNLAPLKLHQELSAVATLKARDMIDLNYFDHYSPTYGSPGEMTKNAGISFRRLGENLAMAPSINTAFELLMDSPGHRANILGSYYSHIGLAVIPYSRTHYGHVAYMVVQLFMTPY